MKTLARRLLLIFLALLTAFPAFTINTMAGTNSITYTKPNWDVIYDNPDRNFNGARKTWDMSNTGNFTLPEWSSLNKPEYNVKVLEDIDVPASKGDVVLLLLRIWQNMLVGIGYTPMQASLIKPDFHDFNELVEEAQIETSILVDKGIINGTKKEDGKYLDFGQPLKRCEFAAILASFNIIIWKLPETVQPKPFEDITLKGYQYWASESIFYVCRRGLMTGLSDGNFNPEGLVTIAEVVEVILRLADTTEITEKNIFEEIPFVFPITSNTKFADSKKTAVPVTSINVVNNNRAFGFVDTARIIVDVIPAEASKYLDIRVLDSNIIQGFPKPIKITYVYNKSQNTVDISLLQLYPGLANLQIRLLDGSNKIINTEVGPKPIDYRQSQIKYNSVLYNILGEIENDISNIPSNYKDYPYILKGIDKSIYELPFYKNVMKKNQFGPNVAYSKFGYMYPAFAEKIQTFYTAVLNIDYETVELESLKKSMGSGALANETIANYINYVKEHKIKIKGSIELYFPIVYFDIDFFIRSRIKLEILSSDTDKDIFIGDCTTLGYIYHDTNIDFIGDIPIAFNLDDTTLHPGPLALTARTDCKIKKH